MHLTSLFPQLQAIVRDLRHRNSGVSIRYSESVVVMRAPVTSPTQQRYALVASAVLFCLIGGAMLYHHEYLFSLIIALVLPWQVYRFYRPSHDMKMLRLQNEVVVDSNLQQMTVEHLHPHYREKVSEQETFAFTEIQEIGVQQQRRNSGDDSHLYGQLFLVLADETSCFLVELETVWAANNLARVLQQLVGLPAQPWEEKPWHVA